MDRPKLIGSSDAPAVVGQCKWRTPLHVWAHCVGQPLQEPTNILMELGTFLEPWLAEQYTKQTGYPCFEALKHQRYAGPDFVMASVDRWVEFGAHLVELKTSSSWEGWGEPYTDQIPENYLIQVCHQMLATDATRADVAVLIGGRDFRVYQVRRDEALISDLAEIETEFWKSFVIPRLPPPVDWLHPRVSKIGDHVYRPEKGLVAELDLEAEAAALFYEDARERESRAAADKAQARALLTSKMQFSSLGFLPGGGKVRRTACADGSVRLTVSQLSKKETK